MFYEEKQINNLLKCPACKGTLDDARLLPCCEETICSRCIQSVLEKAKISKYKCVICKTIHEIPENRHFPANKFISKISSEQPKEIYRSELVETLKSYFKAFDQNKHSLNKFLDDGIIIIKDQCASVRKEVNKASQIIIQNVQNSCDDYLSKIQKYESETIEKLNHIKQVEINKTLTDSGHFNAKWSEYLNNSIISTSEVKQAVSQAEKLERELKVESENLKQLLFDGFLTFEANNTLVGVTDLIGTLKFIDKKLENNTDDLVCTRTFLGHKEWIRCVRFLSKNRIVSGSDDYSIKIWNLDTGECLKTLRGHEDSVTCFEMYADRLISGSWDGLIKIWDLSSSECLKSLTGHTYRISNLKIYGSKLISSSWDCVIKIWEFSTGKCIRTLKGHTSVIYCLEILKDNLLSGSVDKSIKCWHLSKGNLLKTLNGHTGGVTDLQLFTGDKFVSSSFDGTIKVWSLKESRCIHTLNGHSKGVFCLKLLSNDKLVSGSLDATIRVWDLKKNSCIKTLHGHADFVLCFETIDNKLISGSADKSIKVWEV